jgi:hypothetical protein
MKIGPVGAELFHAGGHDETKTLLAIVQTRLKTVPVSWKLIK